MDDLIRRYGDLAVLVGAAFEGETIAILGGFAVHQGYLSWLTTVAAAFVGTVLGDQFFFYLGRLKGRDYLRRRISWQTRMQRVTRFIDTHENWLMLGYRFMYGARALVPFALGLATISRTKFLCYNLAAALIWSLTTVSAGYLFGHLLTQWLGHLRRHEPAIVLSVLCVSATIWLSHLAIIRHRVRTGPGKAPPKRT